MALLLESWFLLMVFFGLGFGLGFLIWKDSGRAA
jgi:hypothetical protein